MMMMNTIMMTTSLAKTTMMIVCTALLCDRPFDVDCETADWSLSHLLPIVIGDHGSRVDPDVANDLLQTWDLSKNLHDWIFGPKIVHTKSA